MDPAQSVASLCSAQGVQALYVFGSRAEEIRDWLAGKGRLIAGSKSDVDLGVLPARGARFMVREKSELAVRLEEIFASRVDLVVLPEADAFVAVNVVRGERVFCVDVHATDEYELFVMRRAGDLAPFERERLDMLESS